MLFGANAVKAATTTNAASVLAASRIANGFRLDTA